MPRSPKVWLTTEQQDDFERFARSRTLAARLVQRAQIVLQAAAGKADVEIAQAIPGSRDRWHGEGRSALWAPPHHGAGQDR